jgi:Flp pilus assembly protein TadG
MNRLLRDRRGTILPLTAISAAVLIGFAGLAVDTARAWLVEARMKTALDAAALMAARRFDATTRNTEATNMFWANIRQAGQTSTAAFMGGTISNPTIAQPRDAANQPIPGQIRVSAVATTPTLLFNVIAGQNIVRNDFAVAQRAGTLLELAITLDATSSMNQNDSSTGTTKLQAAKNAIGTMLDILYAGQERQRNLFVSVVPFTRTINIGTGADAQAMVDTSSAPSGWSSGQWSGCIMARTGGSDITDAAPTGANRFRPYAWPSTYGQVGQYYGPGDSRNACAANNAWPPANPPSDMRRWCHGDNDWGYPGRTANPSGVDATMRGNYMYNFLRNAGLSAAESAGPNLLCAPTVVQPLTANRSAVDTAVSGITAPVRSGGTTIVTGMQGAWYTLSPNFRARWRETNAGVPNLPALPQDYGARGNVKAIVLLTDGEDNWQFPYGEDDDESGGNSNAFSTCGSSRRSVCSGPPGAAVRPDMNFNAYGRLADWNDTWFPSNQITVSSNDDTTKNNADAALAGRLDAICTAIKASGVTIYVIGFEVSSGSATETRLRACATTRPDRTLYWGSPTAADLDAAFRGIALDLVSLRLVE